MPRKVLVLSVSLPVSWLGRLFILLHTVISPTHQAEFVPYTRFVTATIPETFLSFNFDFNKNKTSSDAWSNASITWELNLQDARLITLAAALAPANLRVGGSFADYTVYGGFPGGGDCPSSVSKQHYCLTPSRWNELISFCERTGLRLVYDLNIMHGRTIESQSWDPKNTRALLSYTRSKYPSFPHGFELGNEKERTLSAPDAAHCYSIVRAMIDELWAESRPSQRPILVGPGQNVQSDWLAEFMDHLKPGTLDAVTYHIYLGFGGSSRMESLVSNAAWLASAREIMLEQAAAARQSAAGQRAQMWISETAACWDSGRAGVSDSFVGGFWWLSTLSSAAKTGYAAVCRQALVGGNYSLLDQRKGMAPNPDYWTALLWRRLVGRGVLAGTQYEITQTADFDPHVKGFFFCTAPSPAAAELGSLAGAVTLVYLNTHPSEDRRISVATEAFANLPRTQFVLTAGDAAGPSSRRVRLNGRVLELEGGSAIPELRGEAAEAAAWRVPPLSYGFAVYPHAAARACLSEAPATTAPA